MQSYSATIVIEGWKTEEQQVASEVSTGSSLMGQQTLGGIYMKLSQSFTCHLWCVSYDTL